VVFLLAFASGPYFFGAEEQRWISGGAALEGLDLQIFTRDFLRKLAPGPRGMARVEVTTLTPGEQQLCLVLAAEKLAVVMERRRQEVLHVGAGDSRTSTGIAGIAGFPVASSVGDVAASTYSKDKKSSWLPSFSTEVFTLNQARG
jgi:hypothetical protein